jgi:hypothetical protein
MESERFDALARAIDLRAPRRAALRVFGGGVAAHLLHPGLDNAEAKKKHKHNKKRKTCKSGTKKCGTTCVPAADCCANADCGKGATCLNGACGCPPGQRDCDGRCIQASDCCPACSGGHICVNGVCSCPAEMINCGIACVTGDQCCTNSDCGDGFSGCDDGFCVCPGSDISDCPICCDTSDDKICAVIGDEVSCQGGGCPITDWCSDEHVYLCGSHCFCATSIDDARVCTDFVGVSCVDCASDAECIAELGTGAVCIPNGEFCTEKCGSSLPAFCVAPGCASSSPRRSKRATAGALGRKRTLRR